MTSRSRTRLTTVTDVSPKLSKTETAVDTRKPTAKDLERVAMAQVYGQQPCVAT